MKSKLYISTFTRALTKASKDDFSAIESYQLKLANELSSATSPHECAGLVRHVEYLLVAFSAAILASWTPKSRRWSTRIRRLFLSGLPQDLAQALQIIDQKCRNRPPKRTVVLQVPPRWQARSWLLVPVNKSTERLRKRLSLKF
jgi:hypothetical protein